ncbi:Uncharacterised protein [Vibrio parahaemolyticus]|nr:Uncharacterised protein [Vibrio parahaemolyticus]
MPPILYLLKPKIKRPKRGAFLYLIICSTLRYLDREG